MKDKTLEDLVMLESVILALLVTLFVLGLFGIVQWGLTFFPRLNSARLNLPVTKWWIILLLIVIWLTKGGEILQQGSLSEWTGSDYLNVFYLGALSYAIVFLWRFWGRPNKVSESQGE